jgi:hypothetical protein
MMVAALVCVMASCAENRASFFVQMALVPSDDCELEASEEALAYTAGVLDILFRGSYNLSVLARNQLTGRADEEALISETNGIQISGVNVRIWPNSRPEGDVLTSYYQPSSMYVPPNGVAAFSFSVLSPQTVEGLLQLDGATDTNSQLNYQRLVTVGVKLLGMTNGGKELESPEFYFPITICFGCLVVCTPDSGGEGLPLCESSDAPELSGCRLGQDEAVDCRYCANLGDTGPSFCRQNFCGMSN